MEFETYDPNRHKLKRPTGSVWEEAFRAAAASGGSGIIVSGLKQAAVHPMAQRYGYKCRTRTLADDSGFVLWAEPLKREE